MNDDPLPFKIDLWNDDEFSIRQRLAEAATLSIGRVALDVGAVSHPGSLVTLRGPGVFEAHLPQPRPAPAGGARAQRSTAGGAQDALSPR